MMDLCTHQMVQGVVRTSGTPRENNAYRAELQGFHAMLFGLHTLCEYHHITVGTVVLGMDNETGVLQCMEQHEDPPETLNHVDLIRACRRIIQQLPIQVQLVHVKGHQDSKSNRPLDPLERLNVAADTIAKQYLDDLWLQAEAGTLPPCPSEIFQEGTRIYIDQTKITSRPGPRVRHAVFAHPMRDYLDEKGWLDSAAFDLVNWEAIRMAGAASAPLFRLWAAKNASGQCAVGKMMHRWNFWESPRCPLCLHVDDEDARHVPICPAEVAVQARREGLLRLQTKLEQLETHPEITNCLVQGIRFRHQSFTQHATPDTAQAAHDQDQIGWESLLEGRIASEWTEIQDRHYTSQRSRRCPSLWAQRVVEALWEYTHSLWTTRCTTINDMEKAQALHTLKQTTNERIIQLYNDYLPQNFAANDRYLFTDKTLTERLASNQTTKETWLQAVEWAIDIAREATENENHQMRQTMQAWLQLG